MATSAKEQLAPGVPEIQVPKRDNARTAGGIVAASALVLGVSGCWWVSRLGNESSENSSSPTPTYEPSPTFSPTNTPEITTVPTSTASPTPEATPTLDMTKWWNQIPESPYESVNDVPLYKDSNGFDATGTFEMRPMVYKPYYDVYATGLTLLSATADIKNNQIVLEVTTGADTIQQKSCSTVYTPALGGDIKLCDLTGGNFKVILKQGAEIKQGTGFLGTNLTDATKLLEPGSLISFDITFGKTPIGDKLGITANDLTINQASWNTYRNEVGQEALGRTASNLRTFIPWVVSIYPPNS